MGTGTPRGPDWCHAEGRGWAAAKKTSTAHPGSRRGGSGLPLVSGGCLPVPALQQDALIPKRKLDPPLLHCSSPKCHPSSWELLSP